MDRQLEETEKISHAVPNTERKNMADELMDESIFGDVDGFDDLPDDPFDIPENTYLCYCSKAFYEQKDDKVKLILQWTIDDDGPYSGMGLRDYFSIYRGQLEGKQLQAMAHLKRRLKRGLDLTDEEIRKVKPSELENRRAYVKVVKRPDKDDQTKIYTNVGDVISLRLFKEENEHMDEMSNSFGI